MQTIKRALYVENNTPRTLHRAVVPAPALPTPSAAVKIATRRSPCAARTV